MPAPGSIESLYQFPSNITFVENQQILRNGSLVVSLFSEPSLYILDLARPKSTPKLSYKFADGTGVPGLAQPSPDTLAAAVGDTSPSELTNSTNWKVVLLALADHAPATVRRTFPVPGAKLLNGMTTLPHDPAVVLIADSGLGIVWRLDTRTGALNKPLDDPLFKLEAPPGAPPLGVNGVHISKDGYLYFTNIAKSIFGRIAITPRGSAVGTPAAMLNTLATAGYDDFALADDEDAAYISGNPGDVVVKVTRAGKVVAVWKDDTLLNHPTSVTKGVGKDRDALFVTTAGSLVGGNSGGGRIVKIKLKGY